MQLLGRPVAYPAGREALPFAPDKRFLLLARLALAGDWLPREEVAFGFWPDRTDAEARHALRQLLKRTRALGWTDDLESTPVRLRWRADTDVARFEAAVRARDWRAALALYQGHLLAGLDADSSPELGEWLRHERERLRSEWRRAVLARAAELTQEGDAHGAELVLGDLVADDPLDEPAALMRAESLAAAGRHAAALGVLRGFEETLRRELGMLPSARVERLMEALAGGGRGASPHVGTVGEPAPASAGRRGEAVGRELEVGGGRALEVGAVYGRDLAPDEVVGREEEVAEVLALLLGDEGRQLTITGLGGNGKTTVARLVAEAAADRLPGGTAWVALEPVADADAVPSALAAALGLEARSRAEALAAVRVRLDRRPTLVVLDGAERLDVVPFLTSLLATSPECRVLVTSRVPLGADWERVYPLGGLGLDAPGGEPDDAVLLFLRRARRIAPRLELGEDDLETVARVCRAVGGSPLAIEVAAAWARSLPLAVIAERLERDDELLERGPAGSSLRATLDQAWEQCSDAERAALASLSLFSGAFTAAAAEAVAGAFPAVLAGLVERSLVTPERDGRFRLHPVVRRFAAERGGRGGPPRDAALAHARYFCRLAQAAPDTDRGLAADRDDMLAALATLREAGDVESALRLAAALGRHHLEEGPYEAGHRALGEVLSMAGGRASARAEVELLLGTLARRMGLTDEAERHLTDAYARLGRHADPQLSAWAGTSLAELRLSLGDLRQARRLAERSAELARRHVSPAEEARAMFVLSSVLNEAGELDESIAALERARDLYRAVRADVGVADALKNLGNRYLDRGDLDLARGTYSRALAAYREAGSRRGEAMAHDCLGIVARRSGDPTGARRHHEESAAIYREQGDVALLCHALGYLAEAELEAGRAEAALPLAEECLSLAVQLRMRWREVDCLRQLGSVKAALGDEAALVAFERSASLSRELGDPRGLAETQLALGRFHLARGRASAADASFVAALEVARALPLPLLVATALEGRVVARFELGDAAAASRLLDEAAVARARVGPDRSAAGRELAAAYQRVAAAVSQPSAAPSTRDEPPTRGRPSGAG